MLVSKDYKVEIANILLDTKAVKINVSEPFTFASGIKSPIYCDNRVILGFPDACDVIVDGYISLIESDVEVIAGVATAGIPWAAFIAAKMKKPLAYIRNKPKEHGAGKQIEGADVKGKNVVIIEDLISTGKSSLVAVNVAKAEGAKSIDVRSIFSYGFEDAKHNFAEAEIEFKSISNFAILINVLKEKKYLSDKESEIALNWSKDPKSFKN